MTTRACAFLLATVTSLGVVIPANAAGPSMSGGSTGNQFGPTWNWSVTVPWDYGYGYGSGPGYYYGGMNDQQLQYAMLQQQWAAAEQQRLAQLRMQPPQQPKEPKVRPQPQPQPERAAMAIQPVDPSVRAASKLRMARLLAEDGKSKDAADYYAEIIQKYPGTPAAAQAERLLSQK